MNKATIEEIEIKLNQTIYTYVYVDLKPLPFVLEAFHCFQLFYNDFFFEDKLIDELYKYDLKLLIEGFKLFDLGDQTNLLVDLFSQPNPQTREAMFNVLSSLDFEHLVKCFIKTHKECILSFINVDSIDYI